MILYLIRHALPGLKDYDNRFPGPGLGNLGRLQGKWIQQQFSAKRVDIIWASDFVRTLETATFLKSQFPQATFRPDRRLRERQANEESHESLVARVSEWFHEDFQTVSQEGAVVVAHGGSINMILNLLDSGYLHFEYPFLDQYEVRTPIAGIWTINLQNQQAELLQCPIK